MSTLDCLFFLIATNKELMTKKGKYTLKCSYINVMLVFIYFQLDL